MRGTLKREGVLSKVNPYDLFALEEALRIKEKVGGKVTVLSMGPPQAETVIREGLWMGADDGYLLSDRAFAGADTLATSFTLSQALKKIGFDLIIAGMQSTDGDTAQVGPGVAEFLDIPHVSYVREIKEINLDPAGDPRVSGTLTVVSDLGDYLSTCIVKLPCLITVFKEINQPRLPSFKRRKETRDVKVKVLGVDALPRTGPVFYGLDGSPTRVEKIFSPTRQRIQEVWQGDPQSMAAKLYSKLKEMRRL